MSHGGISSGIEGMRDPEFESLLGVGLFIILSFSSSVVQLCVHCRFLKEVQH